MLVLIGLLGSALVVEGGLRCEERLDVVNASTWPALPDTYFGRNLLDEAEVVAVGYTGGSTHAVLNTANKDVFLRGRSHLFHLYGTMTRELVEMRGLPVKDVRFGWNFIVILTGDGNVWTAGGNNYGQLGHNGTVNKPLFSKVKGLPHVKAIAVGESHCVVLTTDGMLFSWGRNNNGQLGYSTWAHINPNPRRLSPMPGHASPKSLCCGWYQCTLVTQDSAVFTWGYNIWRGRPRGSPNPTQVHGVLRNQKIIKATCGKQHTVLLSATGRLYGWGGNSFRQLGGTGNAAEPRALAMGGRVVRDVVAARVTTLIRTYSSVGEYLGRYGRSNVGTFQLARNLVHARDVFLNSYFGQETYGAVKSGCN